MKDQWTWSTDLYTSRLILHTDKLSYEQGIHDLDEVFYRDNRRTYEHHQPLNEFQAQGPSPLLPQGFECFVIPQDILAELVERLECSESRWWRLRSNPKCILSLELARQVYRPEESVKGRLLIKGVTRPLKHMGLSLMFRIPPGNSGRLLGETLYLLGAGELAPKGETFSFSLRFPKEHTRGYCLNLIARLDLVGAEDPEVILPLFFADKPTEEELLGTETSLKRLPPPIPRSKDTTSPFDHILQQGQELKQKLLKRLEKTSLPWLVVEFDKQEQFFFTNEELRGTLILDPDEPLTHQGIELSVVWEVKPIQSAQSVRSSLDVASFSGKALVPRPMPYKESFSLKPFRGPYTYRGKSFQIDCFLRFRADLPWKIDPEIFIPLRIEPSQLEDEDLDGVFGSQYQAPKAPRWSRDISGQELPTLQIDPLLCRAGGVVSVALKTKFTQQATIKTRLIGEEWCTLSPLSTEIYRAEDIAEVSAGEQRTPLRLTAPMSAPKTLIEEACSLCWWVEVEVVLGSQSFSERFAVAMLPALKESSPYR